MKRSPQTGLVFCIFFFCLVYAATSHAKTLTDISYGDTKEQKFDVYLPDKSASSPMLFMVHGGAWRIGDKANRSVVNAKVARWVKAGWIFISVNYRMLPKSEPYQQAGDVAKALAYVQTHSAEWGGDSSKIITMGHSAGAHLLSLVLTDPNLSGAAVFANIKGGILLDSAALDVSRIMNQKHAKLYDRAFGDAPNNWLKNSAIEHLHSKVKPLLLVCSTRREDSCLQTKAFAEKAQRLGVTAQQLGVDLSHLQINANLGDDSLYTYQVEDFIRSLDPRFEPFLPPAL